MEWTQTINSTEQNWSDRVPADWFTSAGPGGVSFEDIIELSNEAHKDMWINVPALATTDFVTQLANLIYSKLDPGLNVYVEYSNETWNNSFVENCPGAGRRQGQSHREPERRHRRPADGLHDEGHRRHLQDGVRGRVVPGVAGPGRLCRGAQLQHR